MQDLIHNITVKLKIFINELFGSKANIFFVIIIAFLVGSYLSLSNELAELKNEKIDIQECYAVDKTPLKDGSHSHIITCSYL